MREKKSGRSIIELEGGRGLDGVHLLLFLSLYIYVVHIYSIYVYVFHNQSMRIELL